MPRLTAITVCGGLGLAAAFAIDSKELLAEERIGPDPLSALSPQELRRSNLHLRDRPLSSLLIHYLTYSATSWPFVVDASTHVIEGLARLRDVLPFGLGRLPWACAEWAIRHTAFSMFAGGESADGCFPLLDSLASQGVAGLLCYSVEAGDATSKGEQQLITANIEEIKRAIKAAGSYGDMRPGLRPTWVAIKLTGLVSDPHIFERASAALQSSSTWQRGQRLPDQPLFPFSPSLTEVDEAILSSLHTELDSCAALASTLGVRIDIDAEQTWFQSSIDRYWQLLSSSHNTGRQPIVYQTYQTYRTDARDRLQADLSHARANGLSFGAKLVRGAYVESERAHALATTRESPLWADKEGTDACYDACAGDMVDAVIEDVRGRSEREVGVLFASHNSLSTQRVLARFREAGLMKEKGRKLLVADELRGRIVFGQLLGMADSLTAALSNLFVPSTTEPTPLVLKYIPYGAVEQVMPYLIRRAQENKAILSGDASTPGRGVREERKAIGRELRRRLTFRDS